jgi:hypothetical protein
LFEDEFLGISKERIYPSTANDSFAPLANPKLERYEKFDPAAPPSAEHFYQHLRNWEPHFFRENDPGFVSSARWLAEFHFRLQSLQTLRTFERSPTRLRLAYGMLAHAAQGGEPFPKHRDYVDFYISKAGAESHTEILALWHTMSAEPPG